ncbi:unnamed protein product [Peniophora sp. CBMAI 1063]|nr:unnamed protein product [Peniophora sp. CBMAI 1063]
MKKKKKVTVLQYAKCKEFLVVRDRESRALTFVKSQIRACRYCQQLEDAEEESDDGEQSDSEEPGCLFFRKAKDGRILQRSFVVTIIGRQCTLSQVKPYEHSAHVVPEFAPASPHLTQEIIEHCLVASHCDSRLSPADGHDFVLLEFFRPMELENALVSLDSAPSIEPRRCPPNAEVVNIELSDGAGLPSYGTLYSALASGVPMVVSGINPGESNLTPAYFTKRHGKEIVTVVNTVSGTARTLALEEFMQDFGNPDALVEPEKLKDWPPTKDLPVAFPEMFRIFQEALVGPILTSKFGALNLETNMPIGSCPPDTGPKAYLAHAARGGTTTRLHCDMCDAVNISFSAQRGRNNTEGGALWIMICRDDMAQAESLLRQWKMGAFEGNPIHSQELVITPSDVDRLRDAKVRVWTIVQKQGQAVFIPAGVGHQVTNLSSCIKMAVDFVAAANVLHSERIGEELRDHRLAINDTDAEDVLQLAPMCWWTFVRSQTEEYLSARSDPSSSPWTCHYSAAPAYLQVPIKVDTQFDDQRSTPRETVTDPIMDEPALDELSLAASSGAPETSLHKA